MGGTQPLLLYGAEVWADALEEELQRKCLALAQRRGALRVTSAYRTVSESAMMLIAGVIYRRKSENLGDVVGPEELQRALTDWQLSWQNEPRGRWTVRLIDNLDPWLMQTHDQIDYFLT